MAQDSTKVIVPGTGRFWTAAVDTVAPLYVISVPGTTTAGTFTLTAATQTTSAITFTPTGTGMPAAIANALAALSGVGAGKVLAVVPITQYSWAVMFDPTVTPGTVSGTGTSLTPTGSITVGVPSSTFTAWTEAGHTSNDTPLQINRSGGDVTTLDSWQAKAIESSTAAISYALAFNSLQGDYANMKLYYGSNASTLANGLLAPAASPSATELALLNVIQNNNKAQVRYWPRASILGADSQSFDTAKLLDYPLAGTVLASNTLSIQQGISPVGVSA